MAILSFLWEAPLHPYGMQRLIKIRGKDLVLNIKQRSGIYQTINRLEQNGLITTMNVLHQKNKPDKTIYQITDKGRSTLCTWMRRCLSTPAREYPEFPASVSFLTILTPGDVVRQLKKRETLLLREIRQLDSDYNEEIRSLPRLFLLEVEYLIEIKKAEARWVQSVIKALEEKELDWDEKYLEDFISKDMKQMDSISGKMS